MERLKVYNQTLTERGEFGVYRRYFSKASQQGNLISSLFQGLMPYWIRQLNSWTSFLMGEYYMKLFLKTTFNIDHSERLPYWLLMVSGTTVGVFNCLAIMPFDFLKTHMQEGFEKKSILQVLRK